MENKRKDGKYRQLTLEQALVGGSSSRKSVSLVDSGEGGSQQPKKAAKKCATGATAHASAQPAAGRRGRGRAKARRSEKESSSDEFSEPDPDSSSDWLPSRSASSRSSSRESSPDAFLRASSRTADQDCGSRKVSTSRNPALDRTASTSSSVTASVTSASTVGVKKKKVTKSKDGSWSRADWKPKVFPFTATPGPQNAAAELDSAVPADFLELFLTDELLQHIVQQTNLYAEQYFEANPEILPHSRGHVWRPVSIPELKTFFGLSFLTGYIKKPSLEMYWSVNEMEATPYFSQTMSRNRFQIIWRFLHYNDNMSIDAMDKMHKVRPVLDYLVQKFKDMFQPGQNICIDEGMMQWRGRLSFKVYNPQKPVKYGIKSYFLCDSASGYCFNLQPYVGEPRTLPEIVFSLLDRLPGAGYTLFMDNFYNSIALCEQLQEAKTNVCGTLRKNRGEPQMIKDVTKSDLGVGGRLVCHNTKVMVVAWQDKRIVKMVTTCHQDNMESVDVWQRGHREKVTQLKPECVVAYNASMNGVDKLDQNITYYPFVRKSLNWSKKFVSYLFQLSMFNAFVLYRARNRECKTLLQFMQQVVQSWTAKPHVEVEEEEDEEEEVGVEREAPRNQRAPYNKDPESRRDGRMARHKLEYLPSSSKARPSRRCRVCARKRLRSETKMWCKSCRVPLHPGECFTAYHTKQNYTV